MQIRPETAADFEAVAQVNRAAFGRSAEADLVARLRRVAEPMVSLLAEHHGAVVGHILFSPVVIAERPGLNAMGLAPMAVAPEVQRGGIGSALVRTGVEACRAAGADLVVVLGHPAYYPRFGFAPASQLGLKSEYEVPDEAFMALSLRADGELLAAGTASYHAAFAAL